MGARRKVSDADIEVCGRTYVQFGHHMTAPALATVQHKIGWAISKPMAIKWARYWTSQRFEFLPPDGAEERADPGKVGETSESLPATIDDLAGLEEGEKLKRPIGIQSTYLASGMHAN